MRISKIAFYLLSLILISSCVTSKRITQDAKYHSDALSVCLKYMLETEGLLIGKYPCNTGILYINSNLYLYGSSRNGLYKEFMKNDKNKKQAKGHCITINDLVVNSHIPYELIPAKIVDKDGHPYSSSERTSPKGKYRDKKLHVASPVLFDYNTNENCVFVTILYGSDTQNIKFIINKVDGIWEVIDHSDWWEY